MTQATPPDVEALHTEMTGNQQQFRYGGATTLLDMPGLSPVPPGSYGTYRLMLSDPTIALARMVVMAPIVAGAWSYESGAEAPDGAVALVRRNLEAQRGYIVKECLRALDFGWQGFEQIYRYRAADGRVELARLKPLLQDITRLLIDPATGNVTGLQNGEAVLPVEKVMLYVCDATPDNPYGRARLENVRGAWSAWLDCNQGAARYDRKIAGVIPVVHYPPGLGYDIGGAVVDHFTLATRLLDSISAGKGLAVPNEFAADADDRESSRPEKRKWIIELLEDRGGRQPGFVERLQYLDALKFRGYLRPERTGLHTAGAGLGQADVTQHAELALADGELLHQEIAAAVSTQIVDPLLTLNFGPAAMGTVRIVPAPLTDRKVTLFAELLQTVAKSPEGLSLLLSQLDFDAVLDVLGVPRTGQENGGQG